MKDAALSNYNTSLETKEKKCLNLMQIFCFVVLEVAQISEIVQNRKYKKYPIHKIKHLMNTTYTIVQFYKADKVQLLGTFLKTSAHSQRDDLIRKSRYPTQKLPSNKHSQLYKPYGAIQKSHMHIVTEFTKNVQSWAFLKH